MRALIDERKWTFNTPGSRLWLTSEGVFLAWGHGAGEIIQQVMQHNVSRFPRSDHNLLAALSEHELIEKDYDEALIWYVAPHVLLKNGQGPMLRCVKLQRPEEIFPGVLDELSPVSVTIGRFDDEKDYPVATDAQGVADLNANTMRTSTPSQYQEGSGQCAAFEAHVEKANRTPRTGAARLLPCRAETSGAGAAGEVAAEVGG